MNASKARAGGIHGGYSLAAACLVPGAMLTANFLSAQEVFVPPVSFQDRVTTVEQASTNWVGSASAPPLQAPATGPNTRPIEAGPFRFHPHLGYQVVYGDGILRNTNAPSTTVLHTVVPGLFVEMGKYWNLDFAASINRYSNADFNNNQAFYLALRGHIPREKWLLDFGYVGSMTEQPQVETGGQVSQSAHLLTAAGIYNYRTRLSVELSGTVDSRLTKGFSDYWTYSTLDWVNYQLTSKTTVGAGAGAGYNFVDPGPDSTFEQLQARAIWMPGAKVTVQAAAGAQFQQFMGEAETGGDAISGTEVFPIFGVAAAYRPFEQTSLSISAARTVGNAYTENQYVKATVLSLGLRQRLLGQLFLDVVPSYNFRRYESNVEGISGGRDDEYASIYAGVSAVFFKKLNASVFYQYGDNSSESGASSSDVNGLNFHSSQVGARLEYRY